jgi:hypothetical protein
MYSGVFEVAYSVSLCPCQQGLLLITEMFSADPIRCRDVLRCDVSALARKGDGTYDYLIRDSLKVKM